MYFSVSGAVEAGETQACSEGHACKSRDIRCCGREDLSEHGSILFECNCIVS